MARNKFDIYVYAHWKPIVEPEMGVGGVVDDELHAHFVGMIEVAAVGRNQEVLAVDPVE